jgi:Ras-related protein Rab-1A
MSAEDYFFKYLILGDLSTGKTSLLYRYCENSNPPQNLVDYKTKILELNKKSIRLQIWDVADDDRFKNFKKSYYKFVTGIIIIYDITNLESFKNLNNWLTQIEKCSTRKNIKILIGNKSDCENERKVKFEEGKEFAEKNNMKFFEISVKDNKNVEDAIKCLTEDNVKLADENKE